VTTDFDLDAYFDRIQWGGGTRPTFETLAGLLSAQMRAIPFEHLDVLLGRRVSLDIESVQAKLVRARRGGYCFEHVTLFAAALDALGFRPSRHSARVTLFVPRAQSPRAHMFLTVRLPEGAFVLDPGFGGFPPTFPAPLVDGEPTPGGATHWMVRDGDYWMLRTLRDGAPVDAWTSTLEEDHPVDFEMANHFTATHPGSPFLNRLMISRFTEDGRVTVMNRDATIRKGGQVSTSQLANRGALRAFMAAHFGFDFAEVDKLRLPFIPEWNEP
jgi:N-hydroxyarylamine O-acetyltransferase